MIAGMMCLVCGHSGFRPLFAATDRLYGATEREFQVVACEGCGLMRLAPQPAPAELPLYYPRNYWYTPDASLAARLEESYRRLVLRDHVRFVSRALVAGGESGPLLVVGCGCALLPRMLRERGFSAMGLDSSVEAAAIAWNTNSVPVVCGDLEHAPLRPGVCAAISMFHVPEPLYDPRASLESARELLHPNVLLIVASPTTSNWQFRLLWCPWNRVDLPRHLIDFRARDLEALRSAAGF